MEMLPNTTGSCMHEHLGSVDSNPCSFQTIMVPIILFSVFENSQKFQEFTQCGNVVLLPNP